MKRLVIDVETTPNIVATFTLRGAYISPEAIIEPSRLLCFAAGWVDAETNAVDPAGVEFYASNGGRRQQRAMLKAATQLLDEADVAIHYNGARFDEAKIRGELVVAGMPLPSPFQRVDLLNTTKRLGFPSARLKHVAERLGVPNKLDNDGMPLWLGCMGYAEKYDPAQAWADMEAYNRQDVVTEGEVYRRTLPYIVDHPHWALHQDGAIDEVAQMVCQNCGGPLKRSGVYRTQLGLYQAYRCKGQGSDPTCRTWSRGKRALGTVGARRSAA